MHILLLKELLLLKEEIIETQKIGLWYLQKKLLFINCIPKIKIKHVLIHKAEKFDVVMSMYNLTECIKNYRKTAGSLLNYYRDEAKDPPADNYNPDPIKNSASFKYESSITEKSTK